MAAATAAAAVPIRSLGLWWLRRDLRLADNEALSGAVTATDALLPVYCLDPREVGARREAPEGLGVPKLGPHRCRFLLQGLADLQGQLQSLRRSGPRAGRTPGPAAHQRSGTDPRVTGGLPEAASEEAMPDRAAAEVAGGSGEGSTGEVGGSGLVVRVGRPELVLPRLLSEVQEGNRELRHVSVHHFLDLMYDSAHVEGQVAEALRSWAAKRGLSLSVHTYWDRTLYHPDDLPYHLYERAARTASAQGREGNGRSGSSGSSARRRRATEGQNLDPVRTLPPNRDPARFASLPGVMTDFRKATQSGAAIRPSLPAPEILPPLPPPFGPHLPADPSTAGPSTPGTSYTAAAGEGETPSGTTVAASRTLLWDAPRTVAGVYDVTGTRVALRRLEELVGMQYGSNLMDTDVTTAVDLPDPRSAFPLAAGYDSAARRLRYFVWGHPDGPAGRSQPSATSPPSLLYFTNTRAQAVGVDNSTKLSPFVALGCITSRHIHEEVDRVRKAAQAAASAVPAAGSTQSFSTPPSSPPGVSPGAGEPAPPASPAVAAPAECDWLDMHLCIRDFFIFTALKEGQAMMDERGIVGRPVSWRRDEEVFGRWSRGRTGLPFVDANMRELAATGWMSNRGRQNVASLLTKDLGVDWRWGAELFECLLLDADVAVNYCNWNYFAGIGNDPRNRHFKTVTQGIQYDEDAVLAATWLPELASLPPLLRHAPWTMTEADAVQYGVVLGRDYPLPLVDVSNQVGVPGGKRGRGAAEGKRGGKADRG